MDAVLAVTGRLGQGSYNNPIHILQNLKKTPKDNYKDMTGTYNVFIKKDHWPMEQE